MNAPIPCAIAECERTGLFYHNCPTDPATSQAGVHALVIGVSQYQKRKKSNHKAHFDLLPGTAPAATHFARFLLYDFHHPDGIPLRSVRLLLMPPEDMTEAEQAEYLFLEGRPHELATFQNVAQALEAWAEDCDSDSDNVAILFVSGHGLATTSDARWAFLPEAGSVQEIYTFGINVTALRQRMKLHRARTQIFIWDLCGLLSEAPDNIGSPKDSEQQQNNAAKDIPLTVGAMVPIPERQPGQPHPGGVDQVTILSRLGTETWSLNAIEGTILTTALVGRDAEDFHQRLMCTAVSVDNHNHVAVTPKRVSELLPGAVRAQIIKGDPGGIEHIVVPQEGLVGLNRPNPLPAFTVELVWTDIEPGESLQIKITEGPEKVVRSLELQPVPGQSEMCEPIELLAGTYRLDWEKPNGKGRNYDLELYGDKRIDVESGHAL